MNCLRIAVSALLLSAAAPVLAQTPAPAGPVGEARRYYEGAKKNILASADKMPADGYLFKPEPDIRTYARVVEHITEAQFRSCGAFNGTAPASLPKVPNESADKATIVAALKASFDECDKAFAAASDATISEEVQMGPAKRSRIGLLWGTNAHDNEQYATLALYLRLKGITPPSSEK